ANELSTFACSLDAAAFSACTSPSTLVGLADGSHTLRVRPTDAASNVGAAVSFGWTVDATPPETTITPASEPANPTPSTSASFVFTASEGGSTFQCKLDSAAYASCTSPQAYTVPG